MRRYVIVILCCLGIFASWYYSTPESVAPDYVQPLDSSQIPSRSEQLTRLKSDHFDILVVGGGATGCGVALDAVTRGLRVALVEQEDFASQTSSRSTNLVHGGVRYLEAAFKHLDRSQYNLVKSGIEERSIFLRNAPHLAHTIEIITPLYHRWEIPYYLAGLKMYDWLAGSQSLGHSHYVSREEVIRQFPGIREDDLVGGVAYSDGQFNDARMCLALALSAAASGAVTLNHVELVALDKSEGRVVGAVVRDQQSGETVTVSAKAVINATGALSDSIRRLDDPKVKSIMAPSSGTHILLPESYAPGGRGLLIPKTEDGRLLFVLPWLGHTLAGTTDRSTQAILDPQVDPADVSYILRHLRDYYRIPPTRGEVLAAWTGLRPLVLAPDATNSAELSRDHVIEVSHSGLITIAGGKWTSYRKMAEDVVDRAIKESDLSAGKCVTEWIPVIGAYGYSADLSDRLVTEHGLDADVAQHLCSYYGSEALKIAANCRDGGEQRVANGFPYTMAEMAYVVDREYALTVDDVLTRRFRLSFLSEEAADKARPLVENLF